MILKRLPLNASHELGLPLTVADHLHARQQDQLVPTHIGRFEYFRLRTSLTNFDAFYVCGRIMADFHNYSFCELLWFRYYIKVLIAESQDLYHLYEAKLNMMLTSSSLDLLTIVDLELIKLNHYLDQFDYFISAATSSDV